MEKTVRLLTYLGALALFANLAMPQTAAAESWAFTPHTADYQVKISVLKGRLTVRLDATETGYTAVHRIVPTGFAKVFAKGSIEETSSFTVTANGVLPIHYVSHDTLSKNDTHADVAFDWPKHRMSGTVNGAQVTDVLETVVRDRVSIQYELMRNLLSGGASNQYVLFDIDELKTLNVRTIGSKKVKVPAGQFEAIGIQHQAEHSSRVTTLWCVAELGFLPVIIEQHRDGKLGLRATLRSYDPQPQVEASAVTDLVTEKRPR